MELGEEGDYTIIAAMIPIATLSPPPRREPVWPSGKAVGW